VYVLAPDKITVSADTFDNPPVPLIAPFTSNTTPLGVAFGGLYRLLGVAPLSNPFKPENTFCPNVLLPLITNETPEPTVR
jgi:hypothetical protein